jgi:hypothetical protein
MTRRWHTFPIAARLGLTALALLALAACNRTQSLAGFEGIGFRETRYQEVTALRNYRGCRDEALRLDSQAREADDKRAKYLASARLLEDCETQLGPEAAGIAVDERMRAYGLSVINYLRGGDANAARRNLDRLRQTFPEKDLYFSDGSSFHETMELLLAEPKPSGVAQYALLNVNGALKNEMRRMRHWEHR